MLGDATPPLTTPHQWTEVRLGEILHQRDNKVRVRGEERYTRLGVRWYAEGAFRKEEVAGSEIKGTTLYCPEPGDFIYNRLFAWKGSFAVVPEESAGCYVSNEFPTFEVDRERADPWFLWRWFSQPSVWSLIEHRSTGSTPTSRRRFKEEDLLNIILPLPPLPEQRAITRTLFAVQKARDARRREITLERERKAALTKRLFTKGLSASGEGRETAYGSVPCHWREMSLDSCSYVQTGAAKGRDFNGSRTLTLPYLRVANVQDGYLDLNEVKQLTIREAELDRYRLQAGDVLVTEGGDFDKLGRGFVWEGQIEPCIHQNHVFAVRVNRSLLHPDFLACLLGSPYGKAYFLSVAHRTTNLACINSTKLKALPVLIPDLWEQEAIVQVLKACDTKIVTIEKETALLDELFRTMLVELISGRLSTLPLASEQDREAAV